MEARSDLFSCLLDPSAVDLLIPVAPTAEALADAASAI
jgi:hypothetical protein